MKEKQHNDFEMCEPIPNKHPVDTFNNVSCCLSVII